MSWYGELLWCCMQQPPRSELSLLFVSSWVGVAMFYAWTIVVSQGILFWYVGMCECCVAPILILMTSMFYKKDEQARRISWFYVMVRIHETHKSSNNLSNYSYWITEWTHSSIWWICCIWYLILWRTCNSPVQDCLPASRRLGNTRWCLCTHMATWFSGTCSHAY